MAGVRPPFRPIAVRAGDIRYACGGMSPTLAVATDVLADGDVRSLVALHGAQKRDATADVC